MSDMQVNEITAEILKSLHEVALDTATSAAEHRAVYANKVKGLQESHGLNGRAFKMASTIRKMENGKREHFIRDLSNYLSLLDADQQQDLMDRMKNNSAGRARSDLEKELDGQPREAATDPGTGKVIEPEGSNITRLNSAYTPSSGMGRHTLKAYAQTVADLTDEDEINRGLEKFCEDHPKLAEEAGTIAINRIRLLGMEKGGGEDLRSKSAREGAEAETTQAAQTGKRTGRSKAAAKNKGSRAAANKKVREEARRSGAY